MRRGPTSMPIHNENCYRCNATVEVALNQPFWCEGFQSNRINTEAPQKQRQTS
jgi:hypothetical protein